MFSKLQLLLFLSFGALGLGCVAQKTPASESFIFSGRTEKLSEKSGYLIGSAASVSFSFKGKSFEFLMQSVDSWEHHNYFCIEVDGIYKGRFTIAKGTAQPYTISNLSNRIHKVTLYKATEAANGSILFDGTSVQNLCSTPVKKKKKIEFIGDSITCGMGNDSQAIPCGTGEWFDQHNAYWAYGPILSRTLGADFLLSSYSGIGMYRNWNDEHSAEAIMPEVYEHLYLSKDNTKPYDFDYQPDLVSICLGTNDLSNGDGTKPRLPFNEEQYTSNYINFIKTVYQHYPKTRLVLLTSPMVSGDRNTTLVNCLKKIIAAFKEDKQHQPIALFEFQPMQPKGCGYHPNIDDDINMAKQLETTFKKLLNDK